MPDNVFWQILRTSCFYSDGMKNISGRLLSYEFWPRWNAKGGDIENVNFVEPDLFLRFDEFDVIIEAKYNDGKGQDIGQKQWKRELSAYDNEYGKEGKPVIFIAVGGNMSMEQENVKVRNRTHRIYKCNWLSLLIRINKYKNELDGIFMPDMNLSATKRLLDNIVLAFNINNVYNINWFNSMVTDCPVIDKSSIDAIKTYFAI